MPAFRVGFTLIELLVVVAVLGILAVAGFGVYMDQRALAKVDRAEGDLQVIQVGLEKYKARFGDYPQVPSVFTGLGAVDTAEEYLLNALNGQIGPAHDAVSGIPPMLQNGSLSFSQPGLPLGGLQANTIIDPWGEVYRYDSDPKLASDPSLSLFGYDLRSAGPDGSFGTADDLVAK